MCRKLFENLLIAGFVAITVGIPSLLIGLLISARL